MNGASAAIGIDLGTSNTCARCCTAVGIKAMRRSCASMSTGCQVLMTACCRVVAVYDAHQPPQIVKDDDDYDTPSFVHYNAAAEPDVGASAFQERHSDPQNTVRSRVRCEDCGL